MVAPSIILSGELSEGELSEGERRLQMSDDPVLFADVAAWRLWLDGNEHDHDGLWLLLAKKGTTSPTSLTYAQALDEALCSGWIDGQKRSYDAAMFMQRFTPRR